MAAPDTRFDETLFDAIRLPPRLFPSCAFNFLPPQSYPSALFNGSARPGRHSSVLYAVQQAKRI